MLSSTRGIRGVCIQPGRTSPIRCHPVFTHHCRPLFCFLLRAGMKLVYTPIAMRYFSCTKHYIHDMPQRRLRLLSAVMVLLQSTISPNAQLHWLPTWLLDVIALVCRS